MNDTIITARGYVGGDVVLRDAGESSVANFRLGTTPRVLNRATGQWGDGVTQWYSVTAWRGLGLNVKRSVNKGDPVIVHGRLTAKEWTDKDGVARTTWEIEAESVGHDLRRGTALFARQPREQDDARPEAAASTAGAPTWVAGQGAAVPAVPADWQAA